MIPTDTLLIGTDFETYYDDLYSMGDAKLTAIEYITDRRFHAHMMGVSYNCEPAILVAHEHIQRVVDNWRANQAAGARIALVAHNTQFDALILYHHYGFVADYYYDTKAMSSGLWHHESSSLKALCERLWPNDPTKRKGDELIRSKGIRDLPPDVYDAVGNYCLNDTNLCVAALQAMLPVFPAVELDTINIVTGFTVDPRLELDFDLLNRYIPMLEQLRHDLITASQLDIFAATYNPDKKGRPQFVRDFERELRKGTVTPDDQAYFLALKVLNSNVAFTEWLRTNKITVPTKRNERGQSIPQLGQQDIGYQQMTARYRQHQAVWDARKAAKSTITISRAHRFRATALAFGGKMPLPCRYSAAHTHRLGGDQKLNAQNMPRNAPPDHPHGDLRPGALRRALRAPPDQFVYVADSSNIEARMLAFLSDNTPLLNVFEQGHDPYIWMAQDIYNKPLNKREHSAERAVGKATLLGSGYGMGAAKFKDYLNTGPLGMPPIFFNDESMYGFIIQTFRTKNYQVVDFWARCDQWLCEMMQPDCNLDYKMLRIRHNKIILPSGLALEYPNLRCVNGQFAYDSKEDGKATPIWGGSLTENIMQALSTELIKHFMRLIDGYFRQLGGKVVLQVHDEVVAVGPQTDAKIHLIDMLALMRCLPPWALGLPVDAEGGFALNYSK